jgi:type I restriction enzyme S subunit
MSNAEAENLGWVSESENQQIQNDSDTNNILEDIHPITWIQVSIGQIANVQSGVGFPISYQGKSEEKYPVYKVGDISRSILNAKGILAVAENTVSETDAAKLKGAIFPIGTTLFAKIGEAVRLNRRAYVVKPGLADNNVMGVKPFFQEMDKFIHFFMKTVDLNEATRSTTVPSIRKSDIEDLSLYLPPLSEQQLIATKLDELLAQVDTIKTRLDAIPKILKRFRQSVLAAAVSGKLTENLRGSASIDFNQSPVTIGVESDTAPKGWNWQKLVDLAILESGHTPRKSVPEYWKNGDVYWICLQDIRAAHGSIINDTLHKPTMLGIDNSSARLLPAGTVCFSRDISVGYTTIMGKEMSTTQHFANWICGDSLNNKFLMFALMAAREHLLISGQGTTVKTIYMPALKEFRLLTPPLKEQSEIVRRLDQLFTYADQIEQRVKDAQSRVNNLTQSILARAFRGELTADWRAQNPKLISGENSAEALLAKIQAERIAASSKTARRSKSNDK